MNNYLAFNSNEPKYTYSSIGIYNPQLFNSHGKEISSVVSLLKKAMEIQLITGQLYEGK
ncbi:MAG: hypothetical protein JKY19_08020 [Alcanivoracaceae bacterium]|nr:hypothetical protein [Alcanivoracaceae bacterium]